MDWIDIIKPYTKKITIDSEHKTIYLVHPHWSKLKDVNQYRKLLKAVKHNKYIGYSVQALGFVSIEGIYIVDRLIKYIDKLDNVKNTKLEVNKHLFTYSFIVNFK